MNFPEAVAMMKRGETVFSQVSGIKYEITDKGLFAHGRNLVDASYISRNELNGEWHTIPYVSTQKPKFSYEERDKLIAEAIVDVRVYKSNLMVEHKTSPIIKQS